MSSTEAKGRLNALLAEVQQTGVSVTITTHGRPIAVLSPVESTSRKFGQLPTLAVPDAFNDALPDSESAAWQDDS